jgi:bifunctional non-homologous end joining protein LigD
MNVGAGDPHWVAPMLATLVERPFAREGWIFERKLDGERVQALKRGTEAHLLSRNGRPLDGTYPELVEALASQEAESFVVDGEVVAFEGTQTSFARLQKRMHISDPHHARLSGVPVFYYLFDLLHLNGYDTLSLPMRQRKSLLKQALRWNDPLRYLSHRNTVGDTLFASACHWGWEGVMAKRADSPYVPGRSRDWLKFKCLIQGSFLVGGYTDPAPSRPGFGALLLGERRQGELVFVGAVGTGFDEATLRRIAAELAPLKRDESPFAEGTPPAAARRFRGSVRGVHWVEPVFLAEVAYTEVTNDGHLRHPRFLRLERA